MSTNITCTMHSASEQAAAKMLHPELLVEIAFQADSLHACLHTGRTASCSSKLKHSGTNEIAQTRILQELSS